MQVPYFQVSRAKKRPFHERELIYTVSEIAKTLGLSEMSIYRYRRFFPNFPKLPTFKSGLRITVVPLIITKNICSFRLEFLIMQINISHPIGLYF